MKAFTIRLTLDEGKLVFEALAELPFKYVYELIGKLNRQANERIAHPHDARERHAYVLNQQDLTLVLKALGELPFKRVVAVIETLNAQIREQMGNGFRTDHVVSYDRT